LKIGDVRRVQWLRPSKAISSADFKAMDDVSKQLIRGDPAVAIHDQEIVPSAVFKSHISTGAGKTFWIIQQSYLRMLLRQSQYDFPRLVIRHAVSDDDLEPVGGVVLTQELGDRGGDEALLIAHGHDDGDKWRGGWKLGGLRRSILRHRIIWAWQPGGLAARQLFFYLCIE
jgi:hypothetical protein